MNVKDVLALFDLPFTELLYRAASVHRAAFRSRPKSSSRRCCRSRPAAAPRTAATARRRRATTPASRPTKLMPTRRRASTRRSAAKAPAPRASAWARPGAARRTATSRKVADDGPRSEGAGPGDLRDARHARATARPSALKDAGLDYYNHNLDTAPEFYGEIIPTRDYQDRLDTLAHVRDAGMKRLLRRHRRHGRDRARSAPA